jgi:hypothetical protein
VKNSIKQFLARQKTMEYLKKLAKGEIAEKQVEGEQK